MVNRRVSQVLPFSASECISFEVRVLQDSVPSMLPSRKVSTRTRAKNGDWLVGVIYIDASCQDASKLT